MTLLVTGGSLGARRINRTVVDSAAAITEAGWQVLHITGNAAEVDDPSHSGTSDGHIGHAAPQPQRVEQILVGGAGNAQREMVAEHVVPTEAGGETVSGGEVEARFPFLRRAAELAIADWGDLGGG